MTRIGLLVLGVGAMVVAVGWGEAQAREVGQDTTFVLPEGSGVEMIWIEPGTFAMGSPESDGMASAAEKPQHEVTITKGFWLGKYEITQDQWESVMSTTPWSGYSYVKPDCGDCPAVGVSWDDMQGFVGKLNQEEGSEVYRLPTEAEWEYACRAGTTTRWSFGEDESELTNCAWYDDNPWDVGEKYAHKVGTKLANPWGLYDMPGNVYEWCQDWYGSYSSSPQVDPTGPSTGSLRLIRGGDFSYDARDTRSAYRGNASPSFRYYNVGARLLRMDSPTSASPATWGAIKAQF